MESLTCISKIWPCVLSVAVTIAACDGKAGNGKASAHSSGKVVRVEVIDVKLRRFRKVITVSATVLPIRRAMISPKVGGRIVKIRVSEGIKVKKGAVLVELERYDLAVAFNRARAQLAATGSMPSASRWRSL